jgi:dCMP deaminase
MSLQWHEYFRNIVHQIKTKSKDRNTQIGAIIVGADNEIVSTGYNSFPRGIDDTLDERQERPEKYYWFVHAEINSIINAARNGVSTKGCTMYMSCGLPCTDCMKSIINAGITTIVCEDNGMGAVGDIWKEHSIRSLQMLKEAGVKIKYYSEF